MKNAITLTVDHPNRKRAEYFLNAVNETLEPVPFTWNDWRKSEDIIAGYQFKNPAQTLTLTVIFTTSYAEANVIAKANSFPRLARDKWGVNGDLLYRVESQDENLISDILSLFAGEE